MGFLWMLFFRILIGIIVMSDKAELFKERMKPGPGTKWWDKIILGFIITFSLAIFVVAPLDAGRFKWSIPLPLSIYALSYLLYLFSAIIGVWAMRTNKFFSSTVRIQTDRDQEVVQSGHYRFIRHPGYVAMIFMFLSFPLMLGSLWALIPGGINIGLLIIRTYLEDITLQKKLSGYVNYVKKARYRLLPGIW